MCDNISHFPLIRPNGRVLEDIGGRTREPAMYTDNHYALTTLQDSGIYRFTDDVPSTWKFLSKVCKVSFVSRTCICLRAGAVVLREEHSTYEAHSLREHRITFFTRYNRTGR